MQTLLNETKQENEVGELIKRMKVQNHDMHKLIKQCRLVLTKLNDKKKEQIQVTISYSALAPSYTRTHAGTQCSRMRPHAHRSSLAQARCVVQRAAA